MPDEAVYRRFGFLNLYLFADNETATQHQDRNHDAPLDRDQPSLGLAFTAARL